MLAAIAGITGYTLRDLWRKPEVTPVEKPAVITQPDTLVLVNPPARPAPQKPSTGKNNVQITVKDKAKVGTIITGDSNKIDIKQDF